jgi:hypothetical protein
VCFKDVTGWEPWLSSGLPEVRLGNEEGDFGSQKESHWLSRILKSRVIIWQNVGLVETSAVEWSALDKTASSIARAVPVRT